MQDAALPSLFNTRTPFIQEIHVDIYGTNSLENAGPCILLLKAERKKGSFASLLVWDFPLSCVFRL